VERWPPLLDHLWPAVKRTAQWQMDRSRRFGLPDHLANTYDLYGHEQKDITAYNGPLHLAAMQAAAKIAELEDDADLARSCQESLTRGKQQFDKLCWNGEYYRCWWVAQGKQSPSLQSDTLYGQVWASLLGLGAIVDPDKARRHLTAEVKYNRTPFGLMALSQRNVDVFDRTVWQSGSLDWTALNLLLGGDAKASLTEAGCVVNHWRDGLRDFWDWRDLTHCETGQPWCNSHYSRQLILWAIPLALSGQQYSAPEKTLSFAPRPNAPSRLPWFVPGANGVLERTASGSYRIAVLSGKLALDKLQVAGAKVLHNLTLREGQAAELASE
jgi:non-lysosomal glucosylceramidase